MILKCLYIFLTISLKLVSTEDLLSKFILYPKYRLQYKSPNDYVPLYMIKGPEIVDDYMANHFRPKQIVKRSQYPLDRIKRQVAEDDQLKKLLDSFGGSTEAPNSVTDNTKENTEDVVTSNPKSGFYYLIDWNTFVEIDNQNGKRVNFRLAPKYGDPKRFFSVTVP